LSRQKGKDRKFTDNLRANEELRKDVPPRNRGKNPAGKNRTLLLSKKKRKKIAQRYGTHRGWEKQSIMIKNETIKKDVKKSSIFDT